MRRNLLLPVVLASCLAAPAAGAQAVPNGSGSNAEVKSIAFPARGDYRHRAKIAANYDRFKDSALVRLAVPLEPARGVSGLLNRISGPPLAIELGYVAHGEPPKSVPPGVVAQFILQDVKNAGQDDGGPTSTNLVLLLNGSERLQLEATRLSHTPTAISDSRVSVKDVYGVRFHTGAFLRLAQAQSAEGRIDGKEFRLNAEAFAAIRDFASRMAPEGVTAVPMDFGLDVVQAVAAAPNQSSSATPVATGPVGAVIGATGTSGARRYGEVTVRWTVVDDGSATRDHGVATGEPLTRVARPCSAERVCVQTADLRVTALETPSWFAQKVPFIVSYEIENRGRTESRPVEILTCGEAPRQHGPCAGEPLDVFTLPALKPGEVARIRRTAVITDDSYRYGAAKFAVVVDPDRVGSERDYDNNVRAATNDSQREAPHLEAVRPLTIQEEVRITEVRRPLVVTARLRNAARSTASGDAEFKIEFSNHWRCTPTHSTLTAGLPSIPARAVVDITFELPAVAANCSKGHSFWISFKAPEVYPVPGSNFRVLDVNKALELK